MAKSTEPNKPSSRQKMLSLMRERYPERKFNDLDAAEPAADADDLDDAIDETLEGLINGQKEYDEKNAKLMELLITDPSAAEFIQNWVETKDPRTALINTFGDELGMSDEAKANFKTQLDGWRERKAANDAITSGLAANWDESLQALESWGDEKGLSPDVKRDVMVRLLGITFNGMENKYGPEEFDMVLRAMNHDSDVNAAREEGLVTGRNERIAAERRDRANGGSNVPAGNGLSGVRVREKQPDNRPKSAFAGIK